MLAAMYFLAWLSLNGMPPSHDHTIQAGLHDLSQTAPSNLLNQPGLPHDPSQSHHASFKFQQDT